MSNRNPLLCKKRIHGTGTNSSQNPTVRQPGHGKDRKQDPSGISVAITYNESLQGWPVVHLLCFVIPRWHLIYRRLFALGSVPMFLDIPMTDITPKHHGMRKENFSQGKAEHC